MSYKFIVSVSKSTTSFSVAAVDTNFQSFSGNQPIAFSLYNTEVDKFAFALQRILKARNTNQLDAKNNEDHYYSCIRIKVGETELVYKGGSPLISIIWNDIKVVYFGEVGLLTGLPKVLLKEFNKVIKTWDNNAET